MLLLGWSEDQRKQKVGREMDAPVSWSEELAGGLSMGLKNRHIKRFTLALLYVHNGECILQAVQTIYWKDCIYNVFSIFCMWIWLFQFVWIRQFLYPWIWHSGYLWIWHLLYFMQIWYIIYTYTYFLYNLIWHFPI